MEIVFLGTSSGTPTKARNVSATVVKKRGKKAWVLVDCGEGTQHQILHTKLVLNHLSAIFITHVHGDHCFGLPGLLASASMSGRTEPMTVIAPAAINDFILNSQKISDTYLTFKLNFIAVETLESVINVGDFQVSKVSLSHRVPSFAYQFTERFIESSLDTDKLIQSNIPGGPLWGLIHQGGSVQLPSGEVVKGEDYLLPKRKPRKIIVGGDNDSPELLAKACYRTDLLIHESTFTKAVADKVGSGPQHSSAEEVARFAQSVGVQNLILTHFSARYQYGQNQGASINEIEDEARQFYQGQLFLANDFDYFYLDKEGKLTLTQSNQPLSAV